VPGYPYGRHYWDFPHRPDKYSYVRAAVEAGYATLALDRIGTGASSHPPAAVLTLDLHVAALAAVVTALRRGSVADTVSNRIVTVGHSLGSAIVAAHAVSAALDSSVEPVDGSILTGFSHLPLPGTPLFFMMATWPVRTARGGERLPAGYRTTIPGTRRVRTSTSTFRLDAPTPLPTSITATANGSIHLSNRDVTRRPAFLPPRT